MKEFRVSFPNCTAYKPANIGTGSCDMDLYNEDCGWDGGDCGKEYFSSVIDFLINSNRFQNADICSQSIQTI